MKTTRTLIIIGLLFTTLSLCAQSPHQPALSVSVPFAFAVDSYWLPAGDYQIEAGATERAIRIASVDGTHSAVIHTVTKQAHSRSVNSRLVFQKYGDEYFLAEVWRKDDDYSRSPVVYKRQRAIAQIGDRAESDIVLAYAGH